MVQDKNALQQQVALLKLASQDDMAALQKQLANVVAECDVAHDQIKAAEQQAAAETAHRVRVEGSAHDVQQQLSRQTAEAGKAQQACKKLHEQVGQAQVTCNCGRLLTDSHGKQAHTACCSFFRNIWLLVNQQHSVTAFLVLHLVQLYAQSSQSVRP